ncbi:MAG: glycine zipper 2TM domain-containing protein [Burkholderiaceae bacterium]|nr:glycine zipper 2TM domain-containing protein [Burkholderiaceae bacterium]
MQDTTNPIPAPARRTPHPMFLIAAAAVAAVSLIAAAQWLAPKDAQSQGAQQAAQQAAAKPAAKPAPATRVAATCPDCGVIAAIHEVKQAGEGTGAGAVAGGVVGGVVGHQFGGGRGKDAMTVVGAVGGAVAGHQIEKQMRAKTVYRIDVKMEDGSVRSITQSTPPALAVGAKVRVNGNQLVARG